MRHGHIDLDLSLQEFLTSQDEESLGELIRDGLADPKNRNGHPDGEPHRIARDRISGKYFVKIADHLPSELNSSHLEKRHDHIKKLKPFHVSGAGYWVPLDEIHADHPHAECEPIRAAHKKRA